MSLTDLQKYVETLTGVSMPVDLLKIAKNVGYHHYAPKGLLKPMSGPPMFTLVVDAECCLTRLYGGYFSDWICGGEWNRLMEFLSIFIETVRAHNLELAVFFNGALEQQRLEQWAQAQAVRRSHINSALKHVSVKGTPPPKIWWVSPIGLSTVLRMALRNLGIQVMCSMNDHHQEVIAFCRENNYHGLVADDSEYIMFNPVRYFSSQQLKLTFKGSLETKELLLNEVSKSLNLPKHYFGYLATLLGNFMLKSEDLKDFYATLIPDYDAEKTSTTDLLNNLTKYIVENCSSNNPTTIATGVFGSAEDPRVTKFKNSVQYYMHGPSKGGFNRFKSMLNQDSKSPSPNKSGENESVEKSTERPKFSQSRSNRLKIEFCPQIKSTPLKLPPVPNEVLRTATERHQSGLMSPWIYQTLVCGEIKILASVQDEVCSEYPNATIFFRPIRQRIYAILFNHYHHTYLAKQSGESKEGSKHAVPEIAIREWIYTKNNSYQHPVHVKALPISWAVPTVQRLWFGSVIEDKKRRLRAFLSCVSSDSPLMLNTNYVPQHLLLMASVLRFIMSFMETALLKKQEVDAFIVTALSPNLGNVEFIQSLMLPTVDARGCQLASFFMMGIETALFANDACGSPIPWVMCCPWLFFDGKLFHHYLIKAYKSRNLLELCDRNVEYVKKVERCREAIFEGIRPKFIVSPPLMPNVPPRVNSSSVGRGILPPPPMHGGHRRGRGRGMMMNSISSGGQLQVAGVIVGSWGPNYSLAKNLGNNYGPRSPPGGFYRGPMNRGIPRPHYPTIRGRPAVLAKRRMIKGKDIKPPPAAAANSKKQQQQQPLENVQNAVEYDNEYKENEQNAANGEVQSQSVEQLIQQPPISEHFSAPYKNSTYSQPAYMQAPPPVTYAHTTENYVTAYTNEPQANNVPNHLENINNLPHFQSHHMPPHYPNHLIHPPPALGSAPTAQHLAQAGHHAVQQNIYVTHQTNGFKSPNSGLNVLE